MLITYTFGGNDGAVDIGLSRWLVGGETCEAASSTPCWGVVTPLAETVAQANINRESVYEPFLHKIIAEQTFGEVTLNLTEVGVFSNPNVCVNFGSADAPNPLCVQNCDTGDDCPTGFACANLLSGGGGLCWPNCFEADDCPGSEMCVTQGTTRACDAAQGV